MLILCTKSIRPLKHGVVYEGEFSEDQQFIAIRHNHRVIQVPAHYFTPVTQRLSNWLDRSYRSPEECKAYHDANTRWNLRK